MPNSWGGIDEDGDWITTKHSLTIVLTFCLGVANFSILEEGVRSLFTSEIKKIKINGLEEIIEHNFNRDFLVMLKKKYEKKIDELEFQHKIERDKKNNCDKLGIDETPAGLYHSCYKELICNINYCLKNEPASKKSHPTTRLQTTTNLHQQRGENI